MTRPTLSDEQIFQVARHIEDRGARGTYLKQACGENTALREQVQLLLAAHDDSSGFLESPCAAVTPIPPTKGDPIKEMLGTEIGPYKLLQQIGEGGFGMVFMAEQAHPVRRKVALKVIKPGMDSRQVIARFEAERQALALMDHPNIATVHDGGETELGRPYFVMELVKGVPLTEYCDANHLPVPQRLQLFRDVCHAVQHAHQKGIIHRDIKPANIMVTLHDGKPVPKVIDFGVSKALSQQLTEKTLFTAYGQMVGTPAYMSPEQAEMSGLDIDTRSDIYALGVLLYELLTGGTPLDSNRLRKAGYTELLQIIREEEPPKPSTRITTLGGRATIVSSNRGTDPKRLGQFVRGDLDWIVMKALDKDRNRRYESANAFAADIERFLSHQVVHACPPSAWHRCRKFARRNRATLWMTTTVLGILLVAMTALLLVYLRMDRVAVAQRNDAEATRLVEGLLQADTRQVPLTLASLAGYRRWAEDDLTAAFAKSPQGSNARLHAGLALLPIDRSVIGYLREQLLAVSPIQLEVVRDLLADHRAELIEPYWEIARSSQQPPALRFRAGCALAGFDPENEYWRDEEYTMLVAKQLVSVLPSELAPFRNTLTPVKHDLVGPLSAIYRDEAASEQALLFAAETLAHFLSDDARALFDLLADADEKQFPVMFKKLRSHRTKAIQLAEAELGVQKVLTHGSQQDQEAGAIRRANAAVMLLKMESPRKVWATFQHCPDPGARSYLIHRVSPLGCDPRELIARYHVESDLSVRRALLLSLGEFSEQRLPSSDRDALMRDLLTIYRLPSDPGLRSAAEWLLRKWDRGQAVREIDRELQQQAVASELVARDSLPWYISPQGHTFVVLAADEFVMGSIDRRQGESDSDETPHRRKIGRKFAISTKEVTAAQWQQFQYDVGTDTPADDEPLDSIVAANCPITHVTWYQAAWYCNWLSEVEKIPTDQWCYEPNHAGVYGPNMKAKPNHWELKGYRLPTEAEWEFACRAGTTTQRYHGQSEDLLAQYAWYQATSEHHTWPVGSLKPNEFGLFDMLGNAVEWCYDEYKAYPLDQAGPIQDAPPSGVLLETTRRALRGGAYNGLPHYVRSADRYGLQPVIGDSAWSFRPVRTVALLDHQEERD